VNEDHWEKNCSPKQALSRERNWKRSSIQGCIGLLTHLYSHGRMLRDSETVPQLVDALEHLCDELDEEWKALKEDL